MTPSKSNGERTLRVLQYRLRCSSIASTLRRWYWQAFGMKIGSGVHLASIRATWPHVVSIAGGTVVERDVSFKFDGPYAEGIHIEIGRNVFIGTQVEFNIKDRISIGDSTLIASGCRFIDHDHAFQPGRPIRDQECKCSAITIGADCWIGVNAVVLRGVSIGDGAIVGAGAVLNKSVPAGEIWAGVPARKIGTRDLAAVQGNSP